MANPVRCFGFLMEPIELKFDGGRLAPLPEYSSNREIFVQRLNRDEFVYPRLECQAFLDPFTRAIIDETTASRRIANVQAQIFFEPGEPIPAGAIARTVRPASMYRLPPSHAVFLDDPRENSRPREGLGRLLAHLTAYCFETRVQFAELWIDGRIQTRRTTNTRPAAMEDLLSHACRVWRGWTPIERDLMTNVLKTSGRALSYDWPWEQFVFEYMVLDGCWEMAERRGLVLPKRAETWVQRLGQRIGMGESWMTDFLSRNIVGASPQLRYRHAERMKVLCDRFGFERTPDDDEAIEGIVRLRNGLIHTTLFAGDDPTSGAGADSWDLILNLRSLNQRFIPAVMGYSATWIPTGWRGRGWTQFEPSKNK